jgi:hypothetical protein
LRSNKKVLFSMMNSPDGEDADTGPLRHFDDAALKPQGGGTAYSIDTEKSNLPGFA